MSDLLSQLHENVAIARDANVAVSQENETPARWLASQMPRLAELCARTPAMANVLRDIVEGLERYCAEYGVDPESFVPHTIVTRDGKIIVDLFGGGV
ncbi:hypothetical protein EPN42_05640 [bacterium]|nr:MAG: hypothetical protein EPN42_05640 [bacterium]